MSLKEIFSAAPKPGGRRLTSLQCKTDKSSATVAQHFRRGRNQHYPRTAIGSGREKNNELPNVSYHAHLSTDIMYIQLAKHPLSNRPLNKTLFEHGEQLFRRTFVNAMPIIKVLKQTVDRSCHRMQRSYIECISPTQKKNQGKKKEQYTRNIPVPCSEPLQSYPQRFFSDKPS